MASKDSSFPPSMLVHKTHKIHRFSTHKFMLCDLSVGWGISFSKGCLWLPYISNCGHVRQWRKRKVNLQQLKLSSCSRNPYDIYPIGTKNPGHAKNEESTSYQLTIAWWKMGARPKGGNLLNNLKGWNHFEETLLISDRVACPFYINDRLPLDVGVKPKAAKNNC